MFDEKRNSKQDYPWASQSSSRLSVSLFENSPSAIIVYEVENDGGNGEDYIIIEANEACLKTEGWDRSIIGKRLIEVRPNVEDFGIIKAFQKAHLTGETVLFPAKRYREEGLEAWYENRIIRLPTGEVVSIYSDITEAKLKELHIEYMSRHDALTGLLNRSTFEEIVNETSRSEDGDFTIVIGDLDGLKLINDAFGYQAGDESLKQAAEIIKNASRKIDILCRWGGDEFIVLMPGAHESTGLNLCRKIREMGEKALISQMEDTSLSFSLGCAHRSSAAEDWRDTLKRAENSMYKSKFLGARSYRNIILSSIKNTLYERSFETEEHGERMAKYCRAVGERMDMSTNQLDELEVLGMLHDIGKIAIDDRILTKPTKLTPEEYEEMKRHSEAGFRIAGTIPELVGVAEYILAHHERWDGKGYPEGLAGEMIPLPSRIMSVADAYDAMISDRPYRKAMTKEAAVEELKANAGTQFDPQVVTIFLEYLKEQL